MIALISCAPVMLEKYNTGSTLDFAKNLTAIICFVWSHFGREPIGKLLRSDSIFWFVFLPR